MDMRSPPGELIFEGCMRAVHVCASVSLPNIKSNYLVSRGGAAYWVKGKGLGRDIGAHTGTGKICVFGKLESKS